MHGPRRVALVLALAFLAAPPGVEAQSQVVGVDRASWGTEDAPQEAGPGDVARRLVVYVHNLGTSDWSSAKAELVASDLLAPAAGGSGVASLAGALEGGAVWPATFLVDVADEARIGVPIQVALRVTFYRAGSTFEHVASTRLNLTGHADLSVTADRDTLPAGDRVAVTLEVANLGTGPAGRVEARVARAAGGGLVLSGHDDVWQLGSLRPSASAALSATMLAPKASGAEFLEVSLRFTDAAGASRHETRLLGFRLGPGAVALRLVDAATDGLHVEGLLVNVGNGTAFNPRVGTGAGPRVLVEDLEPNEAVTFRVQGDGSKDVVVLWNDADGVEHETVLEASPRRVAAPNETPSAGLLAALVAAVVAARLARGLSRPDGRS